MPVRIIGKVYERDAEIWHILENLIDDEYFADGKCSMHVWRMDAYNGGYVFLIEVCGNGRVLIKDTTKSMKYVKTNLTRETHLADPDVANIINEEIADFRSRNTCRVIFGGTKIWDKKYVAAESKSHGHS